MQINWAAVGVVTVLVLSLGGGALHVFDRLGKLEGSVAHLSPDSVRLLKDEIATELQSTRRAVADANESVRRQAERAVNRITDKLAEAEKVATTVSTTEPPVRQWCNLDSHRNLNQWYGAYDFDIELSVALATKSADDLFSPGRFSCGSVIGVRSSRHSETFMLGGYDFNGTSTYRCSATGITIPRGASYRVTRAPRKAEIVAWAELRPSCDPPY